MWYESYGTNFAIPITFANKEKRTVPASKPRQELGAAGRKKVTGVSDHPLGVMVPA
jgi:hypothetical protein